MTISLQRGEEALKLLTLEETEQRKQVPSIYMTLSSSRPIPSPNQAEKFPPPLTSFLRKNGSNRSRGGGSKTRSTPLFLRKKNSSIETLEPTSPEVTCIGQVRVKRSNQINTNDSRTSLFCRKFGRSSKPRLNFPVWRRWFACTSIGYQRKVEIGVEKSLESEETETEMKEEDPIEDEKDEIFENSEPPKNALLLMKSRSLPSRPSSLANGVWGSPSSIEKPETVERNRGDPIEDEEEIQENPTLGKESFCRDSVTKSITDPDGQENLGVCKEETETARTAKASQSENEFGLWTQGLTRSKSERTRSLDDSDVCFWRKRRFGGEEIERFREKIVL